MTSPDLSAAELEEYRRRFATGTTSTRTLAPATTEQVATVRTLDSLTAAPRTVTTEPLTDEQLAYLRAELGPETTVAEVQARWERLGDPQLVAVEVVRERLAAMQAGPATFALAGVYSQSTTENLKAYREQLARLTSSSSSAGGGGVEVVRRRTRPVRGR